jgi:hypothetical protein
VTHPFHPLVGKSFELLTHRKTWGEDRVFFHDKGRLRALPASWTDAAAPTPFVAMAAGRAHFRPDDLLRLVELVGALRGIGGEVAGPGSVSGKLCRKRKDKNAEAVGLGGCRGRTRKHK